VKQNDLASKDFIGYFVQTFRSAAPFLNRESPKSLVFENTLTRRRLAAAIWIPKLKKKKETKNEK
jgi:hypothetical protein